jgi:Flp pilus assembly protein TadG
MSTNVINDRHPTGFLAGLLKPLVAVRGALRSRRGSVAVEFALVMPPFLLLCFGFIGANAALFTRSAMQNSAQLAARMMATGQISNFTTGAINAGNATATVTCIAGLASTTVEHHACSGLPGWATFTVTATQNCAVPSVTVTLQATGFQAAPTGDRMGVLLGKTLTASSVMMKEGTCS